MCNVSNEKVLRPWSFSNVVMGFLFLALVSISMIAGANAKTDHDAIVDTKVVDTKAMPTPAQIAEKWAHKLEASSSVQIISNQDIYYLWRKTEDPQAIERIGSFEFVKNHPDTIHFSLLITSQQTQDTLVTKIQKVGSLVHLDFVLKNDPVLGPRFVEAFTDDKGRFATFEDPASSTRGVKGLRHDGTMYLWDSRWDNVSFSKCEGTDFLETLLGPDSSERNSFAKMLASSKLVGSEICYREGPFYGKTLFHLTRIVGDEKEVDSWRYCIQDFWIDSEFYTLVARRTQDGRATNGIADAKVTDSTCQFVCKPQ